MAASMANEPFLFIANRSGLPVSPLELICIAVLTAAMFFVKDLQMILLAALVLALFLFFARWGARPTLRRNGDYLEYQYGKILSKVKLSEISGTVIKGNRFVGRSLVVSGNVQVAMGGREPVKRSSLVVVDVFRQPLEEIRAAIDSVRASQAAK